MIGRVLGGRYEVLERIGGGGMALVYKARCQLLDRLVAIKVLKDEFVGDDEFVKKFKRESQASASLSHPNIVNIYDVGVENDGESQIHYIVMEYIKGGTLKDLIIDKGKLSIDETINYSNQIANALQNAHKNKIVHRDIKPQNIMITEDNRVKVTDFGIARASTSSTVTTTSDVLGSVHYFSPEQARGGYTDEKSDIYSLGIVMYEMVTGVLPYEGESPITVALKHVQEEITPPSEINKAIPKSLEKIILKATEKRQADRYGSINEMIRDLKVVKVNPKEEEYNDFNNTESHTRIIPAVNVEDDYNMKKNKKKKPVKKDGGMKGIFLGIFLAFLVTGGFFLGFFKFKDMLMGGEEITMIDIVGMEEEKAKEAIESLGLKFEVENRVENSEFKAGEVIFQDVKEGTKLKKNFPVKVTISEGYGLVRVPDLFNITLAEAEEILKEKNLKLDVDYDYSDIIEVDKIIRQDPRQSEEVEIGSRIKVTISQGEEIKNVIMPKLTGWKLADAQNEIKKLGLVVGRTDEQPSENVGKGLVTWQSYEHGTELETKTVVDLFVSSGPSEEKDNDEISSEENNNDAAKNKEGAFTFTVTPLQEKEETKIKVIRIQDGVSDVVYNKTHNVNEGEVTITVTGKLGSKFEIFYDDIFKNTLTKNN